MDSNSDKQQALDRRYLRMAYIWAENSYCQRRQVGALIVKNKMIISDGYNGSPSGFENVCEDEDIDKACELGYNLPMGPLKLADAIGIDVMINVMESLYQETADSKYRPAHLYKVLYRAGRLGRKSGKGFYDYTK